LKTAKTELSPLAKRQKSRFSKIDFHAFPRPETVQKTIFQHRKMKGNVFGTVLAEIAKIVKNALSPRGNRPKTSRFQAKSAAKSNFTDVA
jgi:hypothetical protein